MALVGGISATVVRLTLTLLFIYLCFEVKRDGAGQRYLRHSRPVDANQLCYYFWTLMRGGATVAWSILSVTAGLVMWLTFVNVDVCNLKL